MKKIFVLLFLFFCTVSLTAFQSMSIIHVTLTDSNVGLLQGTQYVKITLFDNELLTEFLVDYQYIEFNDGFAEIKVGPISDSLVGVKNLNVKLQIDNNVLIFPIYPSFLSLYSKFSDQLSDEDALYVTSGLVGLGTKEPDEKLTIDGNIKFNSDENSILFSNGLIIDSDYFLTIDEQIVSLNSYLNNLTDLQALDLETIGSLSDSFTFLSNLLSITSSNIELISANVYENVISLDNLKSYINDVSENISIVSQNIDVVIDDYYLFKNSVNNVMDIITSNNVVDFEESSLLTQVSSDGEIRFNNNSYYLYKNNNWNELATVSDVTYVKDIDITSLTFNDSLGVIGYDNDSYYVWLDGWNKIRLENDQVDFKSITENMSLDEFLVVDSEGSVFKRSIEFNASITTNTSLRFDANQLSINDELLNDGIVIWDGQQFSNLNIGSDLDFSDSTLTLRTPLTFSSNFVGIGIDPTESLDVNGAIRLRTQSISNNEFMPGSLVFDGSDFLGWDGADWHILSNTSVEVSTNNESIWTYNDTHLVADPNNNVGIKVSNPQATLDVSGNLRVRDILNNDSLADFLVADDDGDIFYRTLDFSDFLLTNDQYFDQFLSISTANFNLGDIIYFNGVGFGADNRLTSLITSVNLLENILDTENLINKDMLFYSDGDWITGNPFQSSDDIILDNYQFFISSKNASLGDFLVWNGNSWMPTSNGLEIFTFENSNIGDFMVWNGFNWVPSQNNVTSFDYLGDNVGDILIWNGNEWQVSENSQIVDLDIIGGIVGDFLRWDGNTWVSSANSIIGSNGITVSDDMISLDSNLSWSDNTFTIGSESSAALAINRLSSNLINPIQIHDSDDDIIFEVNSEGQLSIGFSGKQNGYSIASNGFNFFSHSISQLQSSIGTTNIGTTEFGPTLLIQSVDSDDMASDRSVIEVLSVTGNVLLEVQDRGYIGISTPTPNATLDVNGFVKLKKYNTPPISCSIDSDGSIALTSQYKTCVCNGSEWVETNDGLSICSW